MWEDLSYGLLCWYGKLHQDLVAKVSMKLYCVWLDHEGLTSFGATAAGVGRKSNCSWNICMTDVLCLQNLFFPKKDWEEIWNSWLKMKPINTPINQKNILYFWSWEVAESWQSGRNMKHAAGWKIIPKIIFPEPWESCLLPSQCPDN